MSFISPLAIVASAVGSGFVPDTHIPVNLFAVLPAFLLAIAFGALGAAVDSQRKSRIPSRPATARPADAEFRHAA
ncbi:MAG TPA: hypothetical protein VFD92_28280 [Candidatus Binatia bacterium]|nr:hypothetical protein [Candidatus Binatia bacterium]